MPIMPPLALVVDDEEPIHAVLRTCLRREGFAVDCVLNGVEAEKLLADKTYDLILIDIYLGEDSGIELLRRIRDFDQQVQVVLITGNPEIESAAEALRLGAFDYLIKPFTHYQVMGAARRVLRNKHLLKDNKRKQANLDAIFRSASDSIMMVDFAGCLVQANDAAKRVFLT